MGDVMAALGTTSPPTVKKFIHSGKWDKHKELWNASPNEELLYPWEVETVTTLSLPPEAMERWTRINVFNASRHLPCTALEGQ